MCRDTQFENTAKSHTDTVKYARIQTRMKSSHNYIYWSWNFWQSYWFRLQLNSFFLNRNLQKNALDKLEARAELSISGKISLKVKLAKTLIKNNGKLTVSVDANATGEDLINTISQVVTNY